jgi:GNAT superfamily N-acetyltransferase
MKKPMADRSMHIRKGEPQDLPDALRLIQELAVFEKEPDAVITTVESMKKDGFGSGKIFDFFVAEVENTIVGLSLFYYRYSTWKGKCLYLEDLIVEENKRGLGIGRALFDKTMEFGRENECKKMIWQVLDWNAPAIEFYKKYNSHLDGEWINCSIDL